MRFLGNKDSILPEIRSLLEEKGLTKKRLVFFDAFCGSGSVANHFKDDFDLIINDLLDWCVVYSRGRLFAGEMHFQSLGFDPIDYLNDSPNTIEGFFYSNYSPGGSSRMYLSKQNAGRVDFMRGQIELWHSKKLLSGNERDYLLACLIESISLVANVAGVYGAFLKHWDNRALKPLRLVRIGNETETHNNIASFNKKLEDIIQDVTCDILYIDPPYTQNQYGTQYHLLQTLVLNDKPTISKITGSRPTGPMRSDWSKDFKAHILFDSIVAKTKARYIIFSYSTDGLMTKGFIESILKRYGKEETYLCKELSYKRYGNHKSIKKNGHSEYLFFVEKKDPKEIDYESPLNYIGSKSKLVKYIEKNLPAQYNRFFDLFGGGFNVGINIDDKEVFYNDANYFVRDLVESFQKNDTYQYLLYIRKISRRFDLKASYAEGFLAARKYYNSLPANVRDPRLLYTVLLYGFQQQLRFNSRHEFNNPVGMRWFNDRVLAKMISFSRKIKEGSFTFSAEDFLSLEPQILKGDFVYMDPPYRLTRGSYNDGKRGFGGWDIQTERKLLDFADRLDKKDAFFMISYVVEHGGEFNDIVNAWVADQGYKTIEISAQNIRRKEILIVNY